MDLFGTTLYMTSLGVFLYKYVYLPLMAVLLALLYRLLLRRVRPTAMKWSLLAMLAVGLTLLPWWDVYRTGSQVTELCRNEGGLHVYRTVEADGFLGASSIEYWSRYGFKYVEGGGTGNRKFRATIRDGQAVDEEVPEYISRYQWKGKENHVPIAPLIERSSSHVIDRQSGGELGTLVWFTIGKGWFDRLAMGFLPGEANPWICGWDAPPQQGQYWEAKKKWVYSSDDLIKGTIQPLSHKDSDR